MDDSSVEFLSWHMDNSFPNEMATHLIKDLYWLEYDDCARPVARLSLPTEKGVQDTNLICLFPPFFEEETNK